MSASRVVLACSSVHVRGLRFGWNS